MIKIKRVSLWLLTFSLATLLFLGCFCLNPKTVKADSTKVDVTDSVTMNWIVSGLEADQPDRAWFTISLGGKTVAPADGTGSYYANDHWTTNDMDWMSYIYINGTSAYKITETNATAASSGNDYKMSDACMANGGWYAPVAVYVDTAQNVLDVRVMNAYAAPEGLEVTLKSGIAWANTAGETLTTSKDVTYKYSNGTFEKLSDEVTYTLTYLNADGTTYKTEQLAAGAEISLPTLPAKVGYTGEWQTETGETVPTTMPEGNLTLKAVYTATLEVTKIEFRTESSDYWFFLGFNETDYTTANQLQSVDLLNDVNLLDKVTLYYLTGTATLREAWDGSTIATYKWGEANTIAFKLKSEYVSEKGVGAKVEKGIQIPMLGGDVITLDETRVFWSNYFWADNTISNYAVGETKTIETTISRVHLRGMLLIGLGNGNDWSGQGAKNPWDATGEDGTNSHANAYWHKIYLANFTSKIKLHVKATDTWVTLGSILGTGFVFNNWGEDSAATLEIDTAYNGTTVDKILFEEGCEFPSFYYAGHASAPHTVHVLTEEYVFESNDMSQAEWAVDWTRLFRVTFNGENGVYVRLGATVAYPENLTPPTEDENYYYVTNWYLNGELYDFTAPVTGNIGLTSDGSTTSYAKPHTVTFDPDNGADTTTVTVEDGECVAQPENPTRNGANVLYEFIGWFSEEGMYDFSQPVTANVTLTAQYRERPISTLSDLYNESYPETIDFKSGQIQASAGNAYSGYNANADDFILMFEFSFAEAYTAGYPTFEIKLTNSTIDKDNALSAFYLGWRFYLYRESAPDSQGFEHLSYNKDGGDNVRTSLGFYTTDVAEAFAVNTTYQISVGYKVIDVTTGKVELYTKIGDHVHTAVYELGETYYTENSADVDRVVFYAYEEAKTITFADPGLTGKPNYNVTLMNGSETVATEFINQITLPELDPVISENELTKVFVGWTTDPNSLETLYSADHKLILEKETTLYAVWVGFGMQDGAAVRLASDSEGSGIRFLVDIEAQTEENKLTSKIASLGTLIVPTEYLPNVAFEHGVFPTGYYSDIPTEKWQVREGNTWTYTAALTKISALQYARSLSARGYLEVNFTNGVDFIYTQYNEEVNARSIYQVATEANKDPGKNYSDNGVILEYVNSVADLVLSDEFVLTKNTNGVGNYTLMNVTTAEQVFTVTFDKTIKAAVINGTRIVPGYTKNIAIGAFIYSISAYSISEDGTVIMFTLGPAAELDDKYSEELVYFTSSDTELDFFLNDYYQRHAGGVYENGKDQTVQSVSAGIDAKQFFWQEWTSTAFYPISSLDSETNERIVGMRDILSGVPVDEYGYVWQESDEVRDAFSTFKDGEHRMGWPFPNPTSDGMNFTVEEMSKGGPFNLFTYTHTFKCNYSASWDFNGDDLTEWTSDVGATVGGGLFSANVSARTENISFTSPYLSSSHTDCCTHMGSSNCTHTTHMMSAYYAPLLELDIRIGDASGIEDIWVWYTTNKSTDFTEDKKVSVKDKAFIKYGYDGEYKHLIFLPMYAEEAWGSDPDTFITQITIEIAMLDGCSMNGNVGLSYVRSAFDTRHSNNNSILISSLRTDYDYTGDIEYLKNNITRARKAMNFYMQMYDADRNLINQAYLVGHDADKTDSDVHAQIAGTIGNGYYDMMFMPKYDFQSNLYFYKALVDLAHLEKILEDNGVNVDKEAATVQTADRQFKRGTSSYDHDSASLTNLANEVLAAMRALTTADKPGFWSETTGRFVAGYSDAEDKWYDYGYTMWNMEAIYYGVATEEQAVSIMDWISGKRVIETDRSTGEDIYFFELAPRLTTYAASDTDMSIYSGIFCNGTATYGVTQMFGGGADMYTSFYDLMNRIEIYGADDAYARLTAIREWYQDIYEYYVTSENYNVNPDRFYWDYYEKSQWDSDGDGTGEYWGIQNSLKGDAERQYAGGIIGIDGEFLESILPVASVYYGFFGLDSVDGKTLAINPKLPSDLEYWRTENLAFGNVKYDLTIRDDALQITDVRGNTAGLRIQAVFDVSDKDVYSVYVNGVKQTSDDYIVTNGMVYITLDMGAVIVEIR